MKILLVHIGSIYKYPPVLSALRAMSKLDAELVFIGTDIGEQTRKMCEKLSIKPMSIHANYEKTIHPLFKMFRMQSIKKALWARIQIEYDTNTVIWVFSDLALKHLGKKLLKFNYVLHMFELAQKTLYYRKVPFLKINTGKYARRAIAVAQAEYNRAQICRAWWGLNYLPYVIPNKPFYNIKLDRKSGIDNVQARKIINSLEEKKIILYQGHVAKERPLDPFLDAINTLGSDFALVIMSGSETAREYQKFKNTVVIPFIEPPYHLQVTSHAYIGLLSYVPTKNEYSVLNSIYCAPNKLYEYSQFGIPMIGNDIPGLRYTIEENKMGICLNEFSGSSVVTAINRIESDYEAFSENASNFNERTDLVAIYSSIFSDLKKYLGEDKDRTIRIGTLHEK